MDTESDATDHQELLIELSHLRAQKTASENRCKQLEDENSLIKEELKELEHQNFQLASTIHQYQEAHDAADTCANSQADVEDELEVKQSDSGYLEAKIRLMEKRLNSLAKAEFWKRAEMEQVREENAELRRRTLEAERTIGELLRDREGGGGRSTGRDDSLKTGSAIFDEGRDVRVEGLPKTIPARAARAAGLITSALSSSASLRGTVGRTLVSPSGSGVAPTARPGNVWATLMNGGAAGKVEYT